MIDYNIIHELRTGIERISQLDHVLLRKQSKIDYVYQSTTFDVLRLLFNCPLSPAVAKHRHQRWGIECRNPWELQTSQADKISSRLSIDKTAFARDNDSRPQDYLHIRVIRNWNTILRVFEKNRFN